jgi:hypothetical protein
MTYNGPFGAEPDKELSRLLGEGLAGPDTEAYLGRLRHFLDRLPELDSEWDVLARWARPGVLVAAAAAGFLLGVALLDNLRQREAVGPLAPTGMPAAALMAPVAGEAGPIAFAVLEDR